MKTKRKSICAKRCIKVRREASKKREVEGVIPED